MESSVEAIPLSSTRYSNLSASLSPKFGAANLNLGGGSPSIRRLYQFSSLTAYFDQSSNSGVPSRDESGHMAYLRITQYELLWLRANPSDFLHVTPEHAYVAKTQRHHGSAHRFSCLWDGPPLLRFSGGQMRGLDAGAFSCFSLHFSSIVPAL